MRVAAVMLLLAGCLHPSERECADGRVCPEDKLCDDTHHACILPEQLKLCAGIDDGTGCAVGASPGFCDAGVCVLARCGDGFRMDPEDCDGDVPPEMAGCQAHGYHQPGTVGCTNNCTFDLSACTQICGDDVINGDEGCDKSDLGGQTCRSFGFYGEAGLACTSACTFETAGCKVHGFCGDGIQQMAEGELCDMSLPDMSCVTLGYDAGSLTCASTCTPSFSSCRFVGWHRMSLGVAASIYGMWGSAPDDVWAVGFGGVILHFDGISWNQVASPTTGTLSGIWGRAKNDVFAAGDGGMIAHYDGTAWTALPAVTTTDLLDIWGTANQVWAVGSSGHIVHFDGASWSDATVGTDELTAVWGFANDDVWAVGNNGAVLHYTGTWASLTPLTTDYLTTVWGSGPNDIYASDTIGELFHYTGSWAPVTTPFVFNAVYAIWGSGPADVFAASDAGEIYHFDGHEWSHEVLGPANPSYLAGWSYDRTHAFSGGNDRIVELGESAWTDAPIQTPSPGAIQALWAASDTDVFAVGESGHIWHWDGTGLSATPMTSPVSATLNGVYGTAAGVVFAVGVTGKIIKYQSGTWTSMTSPTAGTFNGVWMAADGSEGWAPGLGVLAHYTTALGWKLVTLPPTTGTLSAAWGSSANDVWIGGAGKLGHYTGTISWMTSPGGINVRGIWGAAPNDIYAVGDQGHIAHFNGTTWSATREADFPLDAIHGNAADDIFAVGANGTMVHYDGVRWAPVRTPYALDLGAVWSTGRGTFVGGSTGTFGWLRRYARWRCTAGVDCSL